MGIETERVELLKRLKKDAKADIKAHCKRMRMSYQTILSIYHGKSLGTIKTWQKIEKYYNRQNKTV